MGLSGIGIKHLEQLYSSKDGHSSSMVVRIGVGVGVLVGVLVLVGVWVENTVLIGVGVLVLVGVLVGEGQSVSPDNKISSSCPD